MIRRWWRLSTCGGDPARADGGEPDGVAMSSRNRNLSQAEDKPRRPCTAVSALRAIWSLRRTGCRRGERSASSDRRHPSIPRRIPRSVDPSRIQPVPGSKPCPCGRGRLLVSTRLIDNGSCGTKPGALTFCKMDLSWDAAPHARTGLPGWSETLSRQTLWISSDKQVY